MHNSEYPISEPPQYVYRVAYGEDPVVLRPLDTFTADETWPGRFDDANRTYRVLYAATSLEAAYRETLQDFRPSKALQAALAEIDADEDARVGEEKMNDPDPREYIGVVPLSWLLTRTIGKIEARKPCPCVALTDAACLAKLRGSIARNITVADILGDDVLLTQALSRKFWLHRDRYFGIAYASKFGVDLTNLAFFESGRASGTLRAELVVVSVEALDVQDPTFADVANSLGLTLPGLEAVNAVERLYPHAAPAQVHIAKALESMRDDRTTIGTSGPVEGANVFIVKREKAEAYIFTDGAQVDVMMRAPSGNLQTVWSMQIDGFEAVAGCMGAVDAVLDHVGSLQRPAD